MFKARKGRKVGQKMKTTNYVTKASEPKPKFNVALIYEQADVPDFLTEVSVANGNIFIGSCIEGNEIAPVGNFIAWEQDDTCKGGWNVWCKSNGWDTLFLHEGVWYERPTVVKYQELDWDNLEVPGFASEASIDLFEGKIVLHASWGDQTAEAPEPYAILGYPDGGFALLKLDSESARAYNVCTQEGRILRPLVQ